MVFCNINNNKEALLSLVVTILILIDGFLQFDNDKIKSFCGIVTILILIDGFLQCGKMSKFKDLKESHNPYFNRWFSAILMIVATI